MDNTGDSMETCKVDEYLISRYIDGDLTADERAFLDEHFKNCNKCADTRDAFINIQTIIKNNLNEQVITNKKNETDRIMNAVKESTVFQKNSSNDYFKNYFYKIAVVIILMFNLFFVVYMLISKKNTQNIILTSVDSKDILLFKKLNRYNDNAIQSIIFNDNSPVIINDLATETPGDFFNLTIGVLDSKNKKIIQSKVIQKLFREAVITETININNESFTVINRVILTAFENNALSVKTMFSIINKVGNEVAFVSATVELPARTNKAIFSLDFRGQKLNYAIANFGIVSACDSV